MISDYLFRLNNLLVEFHRSFVELSLIMVK